jgi:hypothetical protein
MTRFIKIAVTEKKGAGYAWNYTPFRGVFAFFVDACVGWSWDF